MLSRLDSIPLCDRRTNWQTDGRTDGRTDILPKHRPRLYTRREIKSTQMLCLHYKQLRWRRQVSRHAYPDSVRLFLLLRTGGQLLVVVGVESFSLGEIRQRWISVCNVATKQDAERRRIKRPMCGIVLSRLLIRLRRRQLLEQRTTLSAVLLPSVFLCRTTGLCQLPGDDYRVLQFWNKTVKQ